MFCGRILWSFRCPLQPTTRVVSALQPMSSYTEHHSHHGSQPEFGLCDELIIETTTVAATTSTPATTATQTTTIAESASATPAGWNYLGCYNDFGRLTGSRPLAYKLSIDRTLTQRRCMSVCAEAGYAFAGMEYGIECWCDHRLNGTPTLATSESECSMSCPGDSLT